MPILRYVLLPLAILGIAWVLFWESAKRYPLYVFSAVAIWVAIALLRGQLRKKRDRHRGWRVGHFGRDSMYYEEFRDDAWHRIEIGGELLVGKAHHVIYFGSLNFPEWAKERRDEIIARIKSEFHPPEYEYDDG